MRIQKISGSYGTNLRNTGNTETRLCGTSRIGYKDSLPSTSSLIKAILRLLERQAMLNSILHQRLSHSFKKSMKPRSMPPLASQPGRDTKKERRFVRRISSRIMPVIKSPQGRKLSSAPNRSPSSSPTSRSSPNEVISYLSPLQDPAPLLSPQIRSGDDASSWKR